MNKNFSKNLVTIFSILLCVAVFSFGCGRKAPPAPPGEIMPPVVDDLSSSIDGNILELTWTIPDKEAEGASGLGGFIVYKSKTSLSKPVCKKCPVLFKRVADIPIEEKDINKKVTYNETMEKGYRYIYKVTVYTKTGSSGKDSNYIKFDY